jgi:hypothetical protein
MPPPPARGRCVVCCQTVATMTCCFYNAPGFFHLVSENWKENPVLHFTNLQIAGC